MVRGGRSREDARINNSLQTPEDEYRRMFSAKQSPFRRIRDRATIDAVVRLPSLAFLMSMNMFSSTLYMSMGFASMSLSRMLTYSTNLVNAINTQFEEELGHPWMALSNGDLTKLYRVCTSFIYITRPTDHVIGNLVPRRERS